MQSRLKTLTHSRIVNCACIFLLRNLKSRKEISHVDKQIENRIQQHAFNVPSHFEVGSMLYHSSKQTALGLQRTLLENIFVVMQPFWGTSIPDTGRQTGKVSKKNNKMITGLGGWTCGER